MIILLEGCDAEQRGCNNRVFARGVLPTKDASNLDTGRHLRTGTEGNAVGYMRGRPPRWRQEPFFIFFSFLFLPFSQSRTAIAYARLAGSIAWGGRGAGGVWFDYLFFFGGPMGLPVILPAWVGPLVMCGLLLFT